jgi:hypothetical protein
MHAAIPKAKNANSCSSPWYKPTNGYMLSSVCADTSHCMQIHPQPLMLADTSRYMTWPAQKHADKCWVWGRCTHMQTQTHAKPSMKMARCRGTNTALNARRYMLSFQHGPTHASACWALDTSWNLHLHTRLSNRETHANTCSASWMLRHADSTLSFWC